MNGLSMETSTNILYQHHPHPPTSTHILPQYTRPANILNGHNQRACSTDVLNGYDQRTYLHRLDDGGHHTGLGPEHELEFVLLAHGHRLLGARNDKVEDVGGRAHHPTALHGRLVRELEHTARHLEVGADQGVGVVRLDLLHHGVAEHVVHHTHALLEHLEPLEEGSYASLVVVWVQCFNLLIGHLRHGLEEHAEVFAHVCVRAIEDGELWDLGEGL
mmetsp:Transcript_5771/g.13477  ORF Transcript_5771/g.13477 Transcript_5771/m.13477 type:complete len:217 (-) Transcript_5771:1080-1730(-)